jgi:hypothetical protein
MNMRLAKADGALQLVCAKCTYFDLFPGEDKRAAEISATEKGWTRKKGKIICPRCSK